MRLRACALLLTATVLLTSACGSTHDRQAGSAAPAVAKSPATTGPRAGRAQASTQPARPKRILLGRSALGRPIQVLILKSERSGKSVRALLVVGCIHGTECAGIGVARRLAHSSPPGPVALWVIPDLNPDGRALGTRQNGRGVDLNHNFPSQWRPRGQPWDPEYAGPRPRSEPETRIAMALIARLQPRITIWFHQYDQLEPLVRAWGGSIPAARRYARLAGIPFRRLPWLQGTAPNWQNHRYPNTSSFVVELPAGPLAPATQARHTAAVLELALELARPLARPAPADRAAPGS